jgi:hypothetical protein
VQHYGLSLRHRDLKSKIFVEIQTFNPGHFFHHQ